MSLDGESCPAAQPMKRFRVSRHYQWITDRAYLPHRPVKDGTGSATPFGVKQQQFQQQPFLDSILAAEYEARVPRMLSALHT